jgi:protocatechuate 3,4-dioxygenase beta subunit
VYPIPDDGPVGRMLQASGRHPWRAAHVHLIVSAPGHKTLTTHVFDARSDYLDSDAVFGVRDSLIVEFEPDAESGELVAQFDVALEPRA